MRLGNQLCLALGVWVFALGGCQVSGSSCAYSISEVTLDEVVVSDTTVFEILEDVSPAQDIELRFDPELWTDGYVELLTAQLDVSRLRSGSLYRGAEAAQAMVAGSTFDLDSNDGACADYVLVPDVRVTATLASGELSVASFPVHARQEANGLVMLTDARQSLLGFPVPDSAIGFEPELGVTAAWLRLEYDANRQLSVAQLHGVVDGERRLLATADDTFR